MSVRRHIGFGSTPRFSQLYKEVQRLTDNTSRLAYAKYDPSLGEPPTEAQKLLLAEYNCKLPTLTFKGSEKLHGENMAVCYSQGELWVQGRNHIRSILGDQNGMAHYVEEYRIKWLRIISKLKSTYKINTNTHTIVIDAEWAGGNIQKGNAACSGTDKAAYIFDYFRVVCNDTDESQYKPTEGLIIPKGSPIYLLSSFGSNTAVLNFNNPSKCEEQLKTMAEYIEDASPIAKYFDKPTNVGEGAYLWCEYNGHMLRLKAKGEKHGGKPKQPRKPKVALTTEEALKYDAIASKVTPVWRITQAITETHATEMKHLGEVIKWVIADIAKEEALTLIEAGIELKNLSRYISAEVKQYYFDYLKDY